MYRKPTGRSYLLTGFVHCGKCGEPMVGQSNGRSRRYVCQPKINTPRCGRTVRQAQPVEDLVTAMLLEALRGVDVSAYVAEEQPTDDLSAVATEVRSDETA